MLEAYIGEGTMINSESYDGMYSEKCITAITADLEKQGIGKASIQYKFRDWLISRQRYWGVPIPIIYCSKCGEVAVPDEDLPVLLPDIVDFKPKGVAPLATATEFVNTTCPSCGGAATRDVETMDTFVDSSWYFLRYISNRDKHQAWDANLVKKWLPVDQYIGGVDHATMHLLYARFFIRALYDMKLVPVQEPFKNLVHQGIIKGPDGQRMSKSRGNVVNPEKYLEEYGSDTFRTYLMFGFDFRDGGPWDDSGIVAIDKFIKRVWRLVEEYTPQIKSGQNEDKFGAAEKSLNKVMHHSIKGATQDIERFHFNTAISRIMELVNELYSYTGNVDEKTQNRDFLKTVFKNLIIILAPFTPHIAEELWVNIGELSSVFDQGWPQYDVEAFKEDVITWVIQVNGKIRERVAASATMDKEEAEKFALQTGRIPELIAGKNIHKVIVVPRKLINIVVN
jgi:leucyl-tRNA synthetase